MEVDMIYTGEPELDVMKRIFTGICATWGVDKYDPLIQPTDLIRATIVLGLSGFFWIGQQFEALVSTFKLTNISRGLTHQLVRARFMAFGQEGTRDTDQRFFDVAIPETIYRHEYLKGDFIELMERIRTFMDRCHSEKIPFQDSSYATPKALLTDIVCHTNFRALQEFCNARMSNTMHWEINYAARLMAKRFQESYPIIGLWLAPKCELVGKCQSSATLFPPCGKFPLREGQSDEVNRFGVPYMHTNADNLGANPLKVNRERYNWIAANDKRKELVAEAMDIFKSKGGALERKAKEQSGV